MKFKKKTIAIIYTLAGILIVSAIFAALFLYQACACPGPRLNTENQLATTKDWIERAPSFIKTSGHRMETGTTTKVLNKLTFSGSYQYEDVYEWLDAAACYSISCADVVQVVSDSSVSECVFRNGLVALDLLGCQGQAEAILKQKLLDQSPAIRAISVEWIGMCGLYQFEDELKNASNDKDASVRQAAKEALYLWECTREYHDVMDNPVQLPDSTPDE